VDVVVGVNIEGVAIAIFLEGFLIDINYGDVVGFSISYVVFDVSYSF